MGSLSGDMTGQTLRQTLAASYDALVRKLTRRLGSADLADDALHDAWLKLEAEPDPAKIRDPFAYVLRVATNEATEVRRREARRAAMLGQGGEQGSGSTGRTGLEAADEMPDPEQIAIARSEWTALKAAIKGLPARQREIVLAAWGENKSYDEIAVQHGVSVRTIQIEVKRALEHCARQLGRK